MLLNLSDVFTTKGKVTNVAVPLEMTSFRSKMGDYPVQEKGTIDFTFTNLARNRVKAHGNMEMVFETWCDRCLKDIPTKLSIHFERMLSSEISDRQEDSSSDEFHDDIAFMEGYQLNTEVFAYHEILVNWPAKILCSPDCRGTCPLCGFDLNKGECGCDTFVPDPRMAVIKDIFNTDKEV